MRNVRLVLAVLVALCGAAFVAAAPAAAFPPGQIGTATINRVSFEVGDTVIVKVQHTTPGPMTMQIFSAPVTIGTGTVRPSGQGVVNGVIPAGYSGAHTIQVTGAGGEIYPFSITVTGGGGGSLCNTGGIDHFTAVDAHTLDIGYFGCVPSARSQLVTATFSVGDWSGALTTTSEENGDAPFFGTVTDPTHTLPSGTTTGLITLTDADGNPVGNDAFVVEVGDAGLFRSVSPARVLDTRNAIGAPTAKVGPGQSLTVQLSGRGGLPSTGVGAVVVNATVTNPTAVGYVSVYPAGGQRPLVSNLNFVAQQTVPNAVTVPVSADGRITFFNGSSGTVDLVADVSGYFLAGTATVPGAFASVAPVRVLDTRSGNGAPTVKVGPGQGLTVQFAGRGGLPATGVASVVVNATVTNPTAAGYVTAYPAGSTRPVVSSLNFVAGQTAPNAVTVPVSSTGTVTFFNGSTGTIDLLADVSGYYLAGTPTQPGAFVSLTPTRVLDTRTGNGAPAGVVASAGSLNLQLAGRAGLPATGVASVVLNATVTNPTGLGYITVYPTGGTRPVVSSLNFVAGQTIPNAVTVPVSSDGRITLFNGSNGTVHLLADVAGYYLAAPPA